jgi:DNA-binding HxlR family transcriptional regulator
MGPNVTARHDVESCRQTIAGNVTRWVLGKEAPLSPRDLVARVDEISGIGRAAISSTLNTLSNQGLIERNEKFQYQLVSHTATGEPVGPQ